jgi:molybdopterin molybdotransferase
MKKVIPGLKEALFMTLEAIKPLPAELVPLADSVDRVATESLRSVVDSPSVDASLKDGFAVRCADLAKASTQKPVALRLSGLSAAGGDVGAGVLEAGTAMRVLTGAAIPRGADAVVQEEDVRREGDAILFDRIPQRNADILPRGTDIGCGDRIVEAGRRVTPGLAGLLAAGGHARISVYKRPIVGIVGTGDEIVAPGAPLGEGKLYASNMVTLAAWCGRYGMETRTIIAKDHYQAIKDTLRSVVDESDAVLTSGGAWTGDRDIVAHVLKELGSQQVFHHVRMGPGKAAGFGLLDNKPVFILPGGPPSNLMAFLQIALPGLLASSGEENGGLPRVQARLTTELRSREVDWTDFVYGTLESSGGEPLPAFRPLEHRSRLSSIAEATAVACIPEGVGRLDEGAPIPVQLLT